MKALVCLQTISTIPVSTALDKSFGSVDIFLNAQSIAIEDTDADNGKD